MKLDIGSIKSASLENLQRCLDHVHTNNNLLILDRKLSNILNDLTPFSTLKTQAKIEKVIWINDYNDDSSKEFRSQVSEFNGIIFLLSDASEFLATVSKLIRLVEMKPVYLIVENLTKSFLYQLKEIDLNEEIKLDLNFITNYTAISSISIEISPFINVLNWVLYPLLIGDNLLSSHSLDGGIRSYVKNPIGPITDLSNSLLQLFHLSPIKVNNIYGKGDHSSLFIDILRAKRAEFENKLSNYERLELNKIGQDTDIIVLERNLDFITPLFNQLNYSGIINDFFNIDLKTVEIPDLEDESNSRTNKPNMKKYVLDDELYNELKDLNFASTGSVLNKLAKVLQTQFESRHSAQSINEIKKFVDKLGDLTNKQDLIKKYTSISEAVINYINDSNDGLFSKFLEAENDFLDMDYKTIYDTIMDFLNQRSNLYLVLRLVCLMSLTKGGIREKDLGSLKTEIYQTYGIENLFVFNHLVDTGLIAMKKTTSQLIPFGVNSSNNATIVPPTEYSWPDKLGVSVTHSAIKEFASLSKFFNLEQYEPETDNVDPTIIERIEDYKDQSFSLPGGMVPVLTRLVESLYLRHFLLKPINNLSKRPNWNNLYLENYLDGKQVDLNLTNNNGTVFAKGKPDERKEELILVVVLGGVTLGELSAFKFLEHKLNVKYNAVGIAKKIVLVSSGVVKSDNFIDLGRE